MSKFSVTGIDLKVTNRCNLSCSFCVNNDGFYSPRDVFPDIILHVINDILKANKEHAELRNVFFTGGEPILRLDLIEEICRFIPKNLFTSIVTNGILLNDRKIEKIAQIGINRLKFSYDSTNPLVFTELRKRSTVKNLKTIEENISKAVKYRILTFLRVALGKQNIHDLNNIYIKSVFLGVDTVQIKPIIPSGRAIGNRDYLCLSHDEIMHGLERLSKIYNKEKTKVSVSCFPPSEKFEFITKKCANNRKLYLDCNGNIYICNYAVEKDNLIGNYLESDGINKALVKRKLYSNKIFNRDGVVYNCPSINNYKISSKR